MTGCAMRLARIKCRLYRIFLVPSSQYVTAYPCCSSLSARDVLHPKSISCVCKRNPCRTIAPPATTQDTAPSPTPTVEEVATAPEAPESEDAATESEQPTAEETDDQAEEDSSDEVTEETDEESAESEYKTIADPDSAKSYLAEHFGYSRTKIKTIKAIKEAGAAHGIVFEGI